MKLLVDLGVKVLTSAGATPPPADNLNVEITGFLGMISLMLAGLYV